ncbi:hypothetical protein ABMA28_016655 [Loxostege sticticalis]|uniref:RNA-directed DNA polymerase n=1 Tax=Loxostege sticticalis TaxID=481309 RepID=A0ABD0T5B5_LOXSC
MSLTEAQFEKLLTKIGENRATSTLAQCSARYGGSKKSTDVETFLAAVNVFKKLERIEEKDALTGLPLLLTEDAAIWWQGVKAQVTTWADFEAKLRHTFAPKKLPYVIYQEIVQVSQAKQTTESFIAEKRALIAQLPEDHILVEDQLIDLVYGQIRFEVRERMVREHIHTFDELLEKAREVERHLKERTRTPETRPTNPPGKSKRCAFCRLAGHTIEVCRKKAKADQAEAETKETIGKAVTRGEKPKFACYGCGEPGVIRSRCPKCATRRPINTEDASFCGVKIGGMNLRPVVRIQIGHIKGTAQIDTGARSNVASYSLYRQLQKNGYIFNEQEMSITLADGIPKRQMVLTARAPVTIYGRVVPSTFVILPQATHNITLLGVGFIMDAMLMLNIPQMTCRFLDEPSIAYDLEEEDIHQVIIDKLDAEFTLPQMVSPIATTPEFLKSPQPPVTADIETLEPARPVTAKEDYENSGPIEASTPSQTIPEAPETANIANASTPPRQAYGPLVPLDLTTPPNKRPRLMFDGHSPVLDALYFDAENSLTTYDVETELPADLDQLFEPGQSDIASINLFILNFAKKSEPLTRLTKKNARWHWTNEQQESFESLKADLVSAPVLAQADESKPYIVKTDASSYAIGAVLVQGEGEHEHPVEYASRLLTKAERNYSTTEREALAVVWAIAKFRGYIEGMPITVLTDHQALKWLMTLKSPSGRLARWALQLQAYDITIKYIEGKTNVVADSLSRPTCNSETQDNCGICSVIVDMPSRSAKEIRTEQLKDEGIKKIVLALEDITNDENAQYWSKKGYIMDNGLLYRYNPEKDDEDCQLVAPKAEQEKIISAYHDDPIAGHYGVEKTIGRISRRYYWKGMRTQVENYVKTCVNCQRYKPSNLKPAGLLQTTAINQRFEVISFDLFGPLPKSPDNKAWIFIVEDYATRWVELFALEQATAQECAKILLDEIILRYGTPRRFISDNGSQFVSAIMQQLSYCLDIKQGFTPLYHPETNPVERRNRDLKTQLAILVGNDHTTWPDKLSSIRFAMNTAISASTGYSPAYLTFGRQLRTPDDVRHDLKAIIEKENFIHEITPKLILLANTLKQAKEIHEMREEQRKEYVDKKRKESPKYKNGDLVMVDSHVLSSSSKGFSAKLAPRRDGPYLILRNHGPSSFEIADPNDPGKSLGLYHSSALRPFQGSRSAPLPAPAAPLRKRGRPRKVPLQPRASPTHVKPTPTPVLASSSRRLRSQRGSL